MSRYYGPAPEQFYTLIYRYTSRGAHTWIHRFTSYDGRGLPGIVWVDDSKRDLTWPPLMSLSRDAPWECSAQSALSWFRSFSFVLRWAVILDPSGRVLFDWKRRKEVVTYRRFELPEGVL